MKYKLLLILSLLATISYGQSNTGNYPINAAPHDTDRLQLWQGWRSWSPNNHTFGFPLDSLTAYLTRAGFGAGGSPAGSFQDVQVNSGSGTFLGGQGTLYNGILTLPNGSGQALNIGGTSPDAALYINVPFHNSGHYAIDCWQSEYGFSPFRIAPKGSTIIDQREDYGGHPSALSIQAEGSGASSNAALSVIQNGSSGNNAATFMNGNVGVGTVSPQAMLDVEGNGLFEDSLLIGTGIIPHNGLVNIWNYISATPTAMLFVGSSDGSNFDFQNINGSNALTVRNAALADSGGTIFLMGGVGGDLQSLLINQQAAGSYQITTDQDSLQFSTVNSTFYLPTQEGVTGQVMAISNGSNSTAWSFGAVTVAGADSTGQTANADTLIKYTALTTEHTYRVGCYINITALATNTLTMKVYFADTHSNARIITFYAQGSATAALSTTGFYGFPTVDIRPTTNSNIYVYITATGIGSQTYDAGATIQLIH